jgi:chromate transporter
MIKNLKEIAILFLKLGTLSFGGPSAHIAMMEEEVVKKRKWLTHQHFLDLISATNLIPGPNSTEMTMHCGHERAGWKGMCIAGISFIFPAVLITMLFSWFYKEYGHLPKVEAFIYGIKPAVISIMIASVISLGKKAFKTKQLIILGVITFIACLLGLNEIIALFSCGIVGLLLFYFKRNENSLFSITPLVFLSPLKIFIIFFKIGAILYGGGYVLFAFLDAELVTKGFLSRTELINAIAVGQFTPGPILSTATFIGWQLGGFLGATAATIGIFIPSFLFVLILNPLVPKMRKSKGMSAFLDAIGVASVVVILVVTINLAKDALVDWKTILIMMLSIFISLKFKKVNTFIIVISGSVLGYFLYLL